MIGDTAIYTGRKAEKQTGCGGHNATKHSRTADAGR